MGTAVVYTSGTLSLALAETLVHLPARVLPAYTAIPIEFDDALVTVLGPGAVPADWTQNPPPVSTQAIGDAWVASARSPVLRVPSVIVPIEFNYLLNPNHRDFSRARVGVASPFPLDPRLARS